MPEPKILDVGPHELSRTYHYAGGKTFSIDQPSAVHILPNGSHRVIQKGGIVYRPTEGWLAISWVPTDGRKPYIA